MRGPPPKPTRLKIVAGNPGRRPLPKNEPQPDPEIPEPPEALFPWALEEWNRITPELKRLGLLSQIDRAALAAYCQAWAVWCEASEALKRSAWMVKTRDGGQVVSNYLWIQASAAKTMKAFLTEFGLTPASRTRVASTKNPKASKNPFADIGR